MFTENEIDGSGIVMFFVYKTNSLEDHIYDIEVPPAKAKETEKKILETYGTEEFEIYKACVKRLFPLHSEDK